MLGVWFLPTFVINLYGIFSGPTHFGKKKKTRMRLFAAHHGHGNGRWVTIVRSHLGCLQRLGAFLVFKHIFHSF
jgi:hypothetical protein